MADTAPRPKLKLKNTADLKASQSNVVKQAKLMDSAGTAWHAVKYGNLEVITKLFPSQCNVYARGPVGENVLHIAMLLNTPSTLAIAKYLVKLYGKTLVNTPYQERKHEDDPPGQYEGETALHIAIVNRDSDMVKFLIQNGADVRARAFGAFFRQGSTVYYGEYPLSFAACTGQRDIVSYLKRHGAHVNNDRDTWHNTALHMCVYHDQIDMYDHLVEFCGASENVRNNRGQTPLLLAASLGKVEMFQHIYNKRRKVAWAYGPVTSYSLSLHEIDTVVNSKGIPEPSAMEIMVRKNHITILTDPLVKTLVTTKWERFARLHFVVQATFYLSFVVLQTFLGWLHSSSTHWNQASVMAVEIVCIFMASLLLLLEVWDIYQWAVRVYHRRRYIKANEEITHPLYAIPGETVGAPTREKTHFFNRILGGLSAHPSGALSEGMDDPRTVDPRDMQAAGAKALATLAAARARAEAAAAELWRSADAEKASSSASPLSPSLADGGRRLRAGAGGEVSIDVQALVAGMQRGSCWEAAPAVSYADHANTGICEAQTDDDEGVEREDNEQEEEEEEDVEGMQQEFDCDRVGSGAGHRGAAWGEGNGEGVGCSTLVAAWHAAFAKGHHMVGPREAGRLGLEVPGLGRRLPAAAVCEGQQEGEEGGATPGSAPGNAPSTAPGNAPGNASSASGAPSDLPGNSAVNASSIAPSISPSNALGNSPSNSPSTAPSLLPSTAPSNAPGTSPSNARSNSPGNAPSNARSVSPSSAPTYAPGISGGGQGKPLRQPAPRSQLSLGSGVASPAGPPGRAGSPPSAHAPSAAAPTASAFGRASASNLSSTLGPRQSAAEAPSPRASTPGPLAGSGTGLGALRPGAATAPSPWQLPALPLSKSRGPLPMDIVSVGMPPSSTGLASFLDPPRIQAVTSMLTPQQAQARLDQEEVEVTAVSIDHTETRRRRMNEPSLAGSVGEITIREGSEVASEAAGEFRNRRRGGGGEDIKTLRPTNNKRRAPMPVSRMDSGIGGPEGYAASGTVSLLAVLRHALAGYYRRQLHDPIRLIMLFHEIITFVHFITWASSYGGIGGSGPVFGQVQEFDDIVLSLVMLAGWCSMLYFARGFRETGQLQVMMEMCLWDLILFAAFFLLADIGFTLAFYTLINGTTSVVAGAPSRPSNDQFDVPRPFYNIGYGMVQVLRFLYGEAPYDTYTATPSHVKKAFATMYFVAYVFMVVLLLSNLFIAMIVHKVQHSFGKAEMIWRLRWTSYVLRTECRITTALAQRYRLGEVSIDPHLKLKVYNHVFEVVDDMAAEDRSTEAQIRALEATLDRLKKGGKKA